MRMKHVRDFSLRYDILRGKIKYAEARGCGGCGSFDGCTQEDQAGLYRGFDIAGTDGRD